MTYLINKNLNKFIFLGEIANLRNSPWNQERRSQWLKASGGKLSVEESELIKDLIELFKDVSFDLI